MKLLFDHHLSHKLVKRLADVFPGSTQTLLLGLALPDDNAHSPNEKFDLECFARGMRLSAHLWPELAGTQS